MHLSARPIISIILKKKDCVDKLKLSTSSENSSRYLKWLKGDFVLIQQRHYLADSVPYCKKALYRTNTLDLA